MDIAVIQRGSDSSLRFSFGLRSWSTVEQYANVGSKEVYVRDITVFQPGDQLTIGDIVNPEDMDTSKLTLESGSHIGSALYVESVDEVTSKVILVYPTTIPINANSLIIKVMARPMDIKKYDGIFGLSQYVEKLILTTKGTDKIDTAFGTNFFDMLTSGSTPDDYAVFNTKLRAMIASMEAYIKNVQDPSMSSEDLLDKIIVESVEFDYNIKRWKVSLTIVNKANKTVTRSL